MPETTELDWTREQRGDFRRLMGERVRAAREALGLPQAEVVRRTYGICTQASLSNYETGKRDLPLMTFVVLAQALEADVAELLRRPEGSL